jgi:hypothetical protein
METNMPVIVKTHLNLAKIGVAWILFLCRKTTWGVLARETGTQLVHSWCTA